MDLDPADPNADPVVLRDAATGRAIECFLHSYAAVAGEPDKYVVGIPVDPCVDICKVDTDTDELITLDPDDKDMDAVFPVAAALLAEDDLTLLRSATTVTMQVCACCRRRACGLPGGVAGLLNVVVEIRYDSFKQKLHRAT